MCPRAGPRLHLTARRALSISSRDESDAAATVRGPDLEVMCAANDPQARRLARTDSAALRACRRLGEMGIVHTPLSGVVGGCGLRCVSRSIAGVWRLALGSTALDRNELGALLVAAGLGPPAEHALISLLALNGLRVSEATGADIEHLGVERGHRTLVITRKGGKVVTVPLAPRTARAIDLAVGERTEGPAVPHRRRAAAGPARRRPGRPPGHPPRPDRQARQPAHLETRIHHRSARCRGAAAGCAGGRLPCRSADHHAL